MESVKSVVVICLVLSLVSSGEAFKWGCYAGCTATCTLSGGDIGDCALQCLPQCFVAQLSLENTPKNKPNFCQLGCATSLCAKLSTKQDPAGKNVRSCVNACAKTCNN